MSSLEGHKALVTAIIVVPASSPASKVLCFCWTASLDGTIRYWDFSAPELMKTVEFNMPIYSMVCWFCFVLFTLPDIVKNLNFAVADLLKI